MKTASISLILVKMKEMFEDTKKVIEGLTLQPPPPTKKKQVNK